MFDRSALGIATAASGSTSRLLNMLHVSHDFQEGRSHLFRDGLTSLDHRCLDVGLVASAAVVSSLSLLSRLLGSAGRLLAHQLALRTRAHSWLLALPVALSLFAHRGAVSLRSGTSGTALSRSAYSFALGAISGLAEILGATNIALRLVTVDLACCAGGLLAVYLALGPLTHRVALSGAGRIITLPSALRVASSTTIISLHLSLHLHVHLHLTLHLYLRSEGSR